MIEQSSFLKLIYFENQLSKKRQKERAAHQLPSNVNPQTHKQYRTYCLTNVRNLFSKPKIFHLFFSFFFA